MRGGGGGGGRENRKEKKVQDGGIRVNRWRGGLTEIRGVREEEGVWAAGSMSASILSGRDVRRGRDGVEPAAGNAPVLCRSPAEKNGPGDNETPRVMEEKRKSFILSYHREQEQIQDQPGRQENNQVIEASGCI